MGHAVRAAVNGSCLYGGKVVGTPSAILHRIRQLAHHSTPLKARGASMTLDLLLEGGPTADPAFRANSDPIAFWSAQGNGTTLGMEPIAAGVAGSRGAHHAGATAMENGDGPSFGNDRHAQEARMDDGVC